MKSLYITILLFLSNIMVAFGQTNETDSLKRLLTQNRADTTRSLLLIQLANTFRFSNPDSALIVAQQALRLSRKLNFTRGEVRALNIVGSGMQSRGEYPKALELEFEALRIGKKSHDPEAEATSLFYIGSVYLQLSEYRQALSYFQQVLKIKECPENINIATVTNMGDAYEKMNSLDSAFYYQQHAYARLKHLPPISLQSLVKLRLGVIQARMGNNGNALSYFRQALDNAYLLGDRINQGRAQYQISQNYYETHRPDSSLVYARLAFTTCLKASLKSWQLYASNLLVKLHKENNRLDSAFYYQQVSMSIKDSLYGPEKFQRLQLLTSAEQQRQREILQEQEGFKNKIRLYALLATLGVFLLLAIILYRNNRQKQKANAVLHYQKNEIQTSLTELKSTQSQLIQSEKMASLGELTAGIAHEIQNPLNFVNNFSEVSNELLDEMNEELDKGDIEEAKAISADIKQNLEKINHHGKRADAIVKGMLQHSRSSSGQKEPTDINKLADEYLRLAYHGLRAKDQSFNAELKTDFDKSIQTVDVIPQDMGRVILNLLTNAFYAVNEKSKQKIEGFEPTVIISTKKNKETIEIRVNDNGGGIPDAVKEKIFQPFFTTKPTGQGTGLGLSMSYDIITKGHGGELMVETKEREGTTFIIVLPND